MADTTRIALVGAGAFGRKHISVIAALPGFALAGIAGSLAVCPAVVESARTGQEVAV